MKIVHKKNDREFLINDLCALDKVQMKYCWDKKQWEEALISNAYFLSYYMERGKLVAFGLFYCAPFDTTAHLLKIMTHPEYLRRGIAKELLAQSEQELTRKGLRSVYLEVEESNVAAQTFYLHNGFEFLTVKKSFYSDGANALIYQKNLV